TRLPVAAFGFADGDLLRPISRLWVEPARENVALSAPQRLPHDPDSPCVVGARVRECITAFRGGEGEWRVELVAGKAARAQRNEVAGIQLSPKNPDGTIGSARNRRLMNHAGVRKPLDDFQPARRPARQFEHVS